MKKIVLLSIFFSLFFSSFFPVQSAQAAQQQITILSDIFHRELNGKFMNESLAQSISVTGGLYYTVANAPMQSIWVIDPQLIEEISDMADGYRVLPSSEGQYSQSAQEFLQLLKLKIGKNQIFALSYGSPNIAARAKISEIELAKLQSVSSLRLARVLNLPVSAGLPTGFTPNTSLPSNKAKNDFAILNKTLNKIAQITTDPEVAEVALRSNALLNPKLSRKEAQYLSISLNGAVDRLEKKVKVLPGQYTLTSTNEKIPVTVVNEFDAPAEVILILKANNARIVIDTAKKVTLAEKSRKQILISAKAVANGKVRVEARLETEKGARYGEIKYLEFSISMIGPVITWVMAGAGILLVSASGIQIYRRTRKKVVINK